MTALPRRALPDLLVALDRLDRDAAVGHVRALTASGIPLPVLVEQLLAPAQVEVGRRWEAAERSVAWEHAATAITDVALLSAAGGSSLGASRGRLLVACAEQEWHSLPARMLVELLRHRGWDAVLVGASAPADAVVQQLGLERSLALLVSCTMTAHLPGARRLVEAGHRARVPVVVGGRAAHQHADALGAEAGCTSAAEADDVLAGWAGGTGPALRDPLPEIDPEHTLLLAEGPALVLDAAAGTAGRGAAGDHLALERDLSDVVAAVAAALLVDDPRVAVEGLDWQLRFRRARNAELAALTLAGVRRLADGTAAAGLQRAHQLMLTGLATA